MSAPASVIFVDDEEDLRRAAAQSLALADLPAQVFARAEDALAVLKRESDAVLVSDIRMPGMDGLALLARVMEIDPEFPVILVTGHGDIDLAVSSIRQGAYDFLEKPYDPKRLIATIRRAQDKRRLTLENRALRRAVGQRDIIEARLTGRSAAMVALRGQVRAVAATDADVLIEGETGTGKEVAARALHRASARGGGPFVHINCAALPADLIESELFGHEAGAFAGALRARFGKFEHARGGAVFLDEIDSLPEALQAKLLTVLQNRVLTRLGSNDPVALDMRVIAASKSDLAAAAAAGRFRADLLYRLNVVTLRIPPLSQRREDIPRLFVELVDQAAARYRIPPRRVPGAMLEGLGARDWPGNVRELRNAADRFALGLDLDLDLGLDLNLDPGAQAPAADAARPGTATLPEQMAAHERRLIAATLAAHAGSIKATYEALGISRKALYEKMQRHGLTKSEFAEGS